MRFTGPVRFILNSPEALRHTSLARMFLQKAKTRMGDDKAFWTRYLPDGTKIIVSSLGGINQIWIDVPIAEEEEELLELFHAFYFINGSRPLIDDEIVTRDATLNWHWYKESLDYEDKFPNPSKSGTTWFVTNEAVISAFAGLNSQGYKVTDTPSGTGFITIGGWRANNKLYWMGKDNLFDVRLYWKNWDENFYTTPGDGALYHPTTAPNGWRLGDEITTVQDIDSHSENSLNSTGTGFVLGSSIETNDDIEITIDTTNDTMTFVEIDKERVDEAATIDIVYNISETYTTGTWNVSQTIDAGPVVGYGLPFYSWGAYCRPYNSVRWLLSDISSCDATRTDGSGTSGTFQIDWARDYSEEVIKTFYITDNVFFDGLYQKVESTLRQDADSPTAGSEPDWDVTVNTSTYTVNACRAEVFAQYGIVFVVYPTSGRQVGTPNGNNYDITDTLVAAVYKGTGELIWSDTFPSRTITITGQNSITNTGDDCTDDWTIYDTPPASVFGPFCGTDPCTFSVSDICDFDWILSSESWMITAGNLGTQIDLTSFARMPDESVCFILTDITDPAGIQQYGYLVNPTGSVRNLGSVLTDFPNDTFRETQVRPI